MSNTQCWIQMVFDSSLGLVVVAFIKTSTGNKKYNHDMGHTSLSRLVPKSLFYIPLYMHICDGYREKVAGL